jgi:hypothetical protein
MVTRTTEEWADHIQAAIQAAEADGYCVDGTEYEESAIEIWPKGSSYPSAAVRIEW